MTKCSEKSGSRLVNDESNRKIAVPGAKIKGDRKRQKMPSAGTRAATRVVVKGDRARVLRSGRRLFPESGEAKTREVEQDNDFINPPEKKESEVSIDPGKVHASDVQSVPNCAEMMGVEEKRGTPGMAKSGVLDEGSGKDIDKSLKFVYSRKRKLVRMEDKCGLETVESDLKQRRYGMVYSRKRRWKKNNNDSRSLSSVNNFHVKMDSQQQDMFPISVLSVLVESSAGSGSCRGSFSSFLCSVLMYLRRRRVPVIQLFQFLTSEPLRGLYSSQGIQFLQVGLLSKLCLILLG